MRADGRDESISRVPRWASWTRLWAWVIAVVLLLLLAVSAFVDGVAVLFLASPGALAIAFGLVEMIAPRRFLSWRDADTPDAGVQQRTLEGFNHALGIERGEDGSFTDNAIRRVRGIGAGVSAFGVLAIIAAIAATRGGYL